MHVSKRRSKPALLAGASLLALTFAACSTPQPAPAPAAPGGGAPAADKPVTPKVDRVVLALPPIGTEGNDIGHWGAPSAVQLRPMYDKLIGVDPKTNKLSPELATAWKVEPDGKSYRFTLRKGVQFHDNAGEFTSKDVKMTHTNMTYEGVTASNGPIFRTLVEDVELVNDYEVVAKLKTPDAEFLINISQMVGGFEIVSKADFDKRGGVYPTMATRPLAGTGPYLFKERQQSAFIRFDRVPFKHYRVTPDFPQLELRMIGEPSTRMAGLLTGEIHLAPLPDDLLSSVEQQQMKVVKGTTPALRTFLGFRGQYLLDKDDPSKGYKFPDSPMMNAKVRQALSKAVNRDELNKAFFRGKATNMVLDTYHPTRQGWNPDWERRFPEMYGFDADKAKALLAEAGFNERNPLVIEMLMIRLTDVPASMDIQEAVAGYWRKIGVDTKLVTMDSTELNLKQRNMEFNRHVAIISTAAHMLTGVRVYKTALHGIRGNAVETPEINDFYRKVSVVLDEEAQNPIWRDLGNKSFDSFQNIPLFWLDTQVAVNPKFVADYLFPGSISGSWTHLENIKAAP